MADPQYSVKKITDLTTNSSANDSDLYVLGNQGTATMRKITFSTIASAILNKLTSFTFNSLTTSSKNLPGAVNELNTNSATAQANVPDAIPSGSDLNSYTSGGTYRVASDSIASNISNMPRAASGRLIVIPQSAAYITQIYLPTTSVPMIYIRYKNSTAWTDWQVVMLGADRGFIVATGTVTTSAAGTASLAQTYNTNEYACLSIMTTAAVSGYLLLPYKYGDAANGRWGLKAVLSGTMAALANTSVSYVAIMYKYE